MLQSDKLRDHDVSSTDRLAKITSIIDQLDVLMAELDALNMPVPANHLSLGRDLLREAIPSPSKLQ